MDRDRVCNCRVTCSEPSKGIGVGKIIWPELIGVKGEVAVSVIQRENPTVQAFIVGPGMGMQQDLRSDRVWVLVGSDHVVFCAPFIG